MGIFRQFPYTNFHDMNLDWILSQIQELTKEWLTFSDNMEKWKTDTDTALKELKTYIDEYFENLNIDDVISDFIRDGFFDDAINKAILNRTQINTRMVYSNFFDYSNHNGAYPNGSCYIGNDIVAVYLSSDFSNTGKLVFIDIRGGNIVTMSDIALKHGNSLTYDPDEHKIYAVSLYNYDAITTLLNEVIVVDVSDIYHPAIIETKSLQLPDDSVGIYSMSYDIVTETFGATVKNSPTGSVIAGQVDRIVIYNKELTSIIREVPLSDHLVIGNQGIQAFYNNIAYVNWCDHAYMSIGTYDMTSGKNISMYELPEYINGYRYIGEPESFFYNYDNESWYCTSAYYGGGVSSHVGLTIFEMGLYKTIPNVIVRPDTYNLYGKGKIRINVNNGAEGVSTRFDTMYSISDAINLCRLNNVEGNIYFSGTSLVVGSLDIVGFSGTIAGASTYTTFSGGVRIYNSKIRFTYSRFTADITEDNRQCSMFAENSDLNFQLCEWTNGLVAYDCILRVIPVNTVLTAVRSIITATGNLASATLIQSVVNLIS